MKRLYILRHGETQWNKEEVFRGTKDIPLNNNGLRQAEMAGVYLKDKGIGRILSSPLKRALQTAQAVSKETGVNVEIIDEFTDINFGIWEGLTVEEVKKNYTTDFDLWRSSPEKLCVEGGETLDMVRNRVSKAIKILNTGGNESILIVTHRVICKVIVLYLLNIGNEHFWDMKFDPASITLLERDETRFVLKFSNDTCHLRRKAGSYDYKDF
ncbi:MAG: histidine phosphatase family protein [Syntrophorhabdaceae bacterium]|nr:histidine phosphatase family protein [Syntrophorhabdaceae bacterium]